eukprot:363664-Chlamydomonas_euryale.AAC.22
MATTVPRLAGGGTRPRAGTARAAQVAGVEWWAGRHSGSNGRAVRASHARCTTQQRGAIPSSWQKPISPPRVFAAARTGGDLDALGDEVLRVARRLRAKLAELLDVVHLRIWWRGGVRRPG